MEAKEFYIRSDPRHGLEIHVGVNVTAYRTDWHFHDEWQIVEVLSGERTFEWRSGSMVVAAGHTLVMPPRFVHRGHGGLASFRMFYLADSLVGDQAPAWASPLVTAAGENRPLIREHAHVSPSTSPRRFRLLTGLSPRAYRVQVRLLEARRRLSQGRQVTEVATDLGFADQSHLGRQFKRAFGLTPGEFLRSVARHG